MTGTTRFLTYAYFMAAVSLTASTPISEIGPPAPGASQADCYYCTSYLDDDDPSRYHIFTAYTCEVGMPDCWECDDSVPNGETNPCHAGYDEIGHCWEHHNRCGMTRIPPAVNAALIAAVRDGDAGRVRQIVDTHRETLKVNRKRGLLQWFDCVGNIQGQVLLGPSLAAAL